MTEPDALLFASGEPFTTGSARYLDAHPEIREPLARIYVEFLPEGSDLPFIALLDTGGHYCILNSDVVEQIEDRLTDRITSVELHTARGAFRGDLYTHRITLIAETGDSVDIESTVFVSPHWQWPNILGYAGAVERLRFAVDPLTNRIYFGPCDD